MRRFVSLAILVVGLLAVPTAAQDMQPVVIGHAGTLRSEVLGEDRPIMVSLPAGYESGDQKYPVLYLLDGPGHFHHTTGTIRFLTQQGRMPAMIVVAIGNTNRTRDLTPTTTADAERFPQGGGADRFLDFIEDELFPFIDGEFRTHPYRVLIGHSFGGLTAVHAMLHRTDMFDAWIAISPSLWWDDHRLINEAEAFLAAHDSFDKALFVTLGNEGGNMRPAYEAFIDVFEREKPDDFAFGHLLLEDENHGTIPLRSTIRGLGLIYGDWSIPADLLAGADLDGIQAHARKLSEKYGYEIKAPEAMVNQLGYRVMGSGDIDKAIEIFTWNTEHYPGSANVYDSLGEAYETAGKLHKALELFHKAVERGEDIEDPNTEVYRQHIERIKRKLADMS